MLEGEYRSGLTSSPPPSTQQKSTYVTTSSREPPNFFFLRVTVGLGGSDVLGCWFEVQLSGQCTFRLAVFGLHQQHHNRHSITAMTTIIVILALVICQYRRRCGPDHRDVHHIACKLQEVGLRPVASQAFRMRRKEEGQTHRLNSQSL